MHDVAAVGIQVADRVQPLDEGAVALDAGERLCPHPRHDAHVQHDVRAVGDLDAAARVRRGQGPMQYGITYIVRPFMQPANNASTLRCASAGSIQLLFGPASSLSFVQMNVRCSTRGHVRRMRAVQVTVRESRLVQRDQVTAGQHQLRQVISLGVRARAPMDVFGLGKLCGLGDPVAERSVGRGHQEDSFVWRGPIIASGKRLPRAHKAQARSHAVPCLRNKKSALRGGRNQGETG